MFALALPDPPVTLVFGPDFANRFIFSVGSDFRSLSQHCETDLVVNVRRPD
jgi:hypothetical protein